MTRTTSIPYAKTAALELLRSDCDAIWGGDDAVVVRRAATKAIPRQSITIYGTASSDSEWLQQTGALREERYALDLQVNVLRPGDAGEECEVRAFEIWAVIEDRFRLDRLTEYLRAAQAAMPDDRRHPIWFAECVLVDVVPTLYDKGAECELLGEIRIKGRY